RPAIGLWIRSGRGSARLRLAPADRDAPRHHFRRRRAGFSAGKAELEAVECRPTRRTCVGPGRIVATTRRLAGDPTRTWGNALAGSPPAGQRAGRPAEPGGRSR